MDPLVENEAKLHITNGIEKASGASGVDIKVSQIDRPLQLLSVTARSVSQIMAANFSFAPYSKHASW